MRRTAGAPGACAFAAVLGLAAAAAAGPASRDVRLPAELATAGAAADMAATLRREIDQSSAEGGGQAAARLAVRRVAFDLLFRGAAPDAPQAAAMAGLRLGWIREEIDAAVSAPPADGDRRARFDAALAHFAQLASHGIAGGIDPARPELAIAPLLGPLETAIAAAAGTDVPPPGATWPRDPGPAERDAGAASAGSGEPAAAARPADDAARAALLADCAALFRAYDERAGRGFARVAERWRTALRDPARREAACTAIDALAGECGMGRPGPFERRLRRNDPDARAACLGRADALLVETDRARAAWSRAWSAGRGSPDASARLRASTDLLRALDSAAQLAVPADAPRRLASWGGLAVPPEGWTPTPSAARARLSLSAESLLEGDLGRAAATLRTAEGEIAVLHALSAPLRRLGASLPADPPLSVRLAAVRDAPAEGSFLAAGRAQLALLARLMAEERRARTSGSPALAETLRAMAAEAAARLAP